MNYKLNAGAGDEITKVAKKAKEIAKARNTTVEFVFNDITCLVDTNTVVDWLVRDYMNAHIMEWKTVGADCQMEYDFDTQIELYTRKLQRAKDRKTEMGNYLMKIESQKQEAEKLTEGITIEIMEGKEDEYKQYVATNSNDGYSKAVVEYGEQWAKLMQIEIEKGRSIADIADQTQKPLSYLGITGFQYGCVVNTLAHFWKHGEELRKWHNKDYGHEGEGVVNPAILTIGK